MSLKKYRPVTPSLRQRAIVDRSPLWSGKPFKKLVIGLHRKGGRNHHGRLTSFTQGGGHKRLYRLLDFKRRLFDVPAFVQRLEYDPNRSAWIALICYQNGILSYILAPHGLQAGDKVISSSQPVDLAVGNATCLKHLPIGTLIHNIELKAGKGGQLMRSAGTSAQLIQKSENGYGMIRLPSSELRLVSLQCMATIGVVSNADHQNRNDGKAGCSHWKNRRPVVRGVAMNPVDHPHGGGEGKTSGGRPSVTPWGKATKGKKTRRRKNPLIISSSK